MRSLPIARRHGLAPSSAPCHAAKDVRAKAFAIRDRPLTEADWDLLRAFVRGTTREDLRRRFGRPIAFDDEATLRRIFDIAPNRGEMSWLLDETTAIIAVMHCMLLAPGAAELGLIVRSDCQRRGVGELLMRQTLERAARGGLNHVTALVLRDNRAALGLVAKLGFLPRRGGTLAVELALQLGGPPTDDQPKQAV